MKSGPVSVGASARSSGDLDALRCDAGVFEHVLQPHARQRALPIAP